MSDLTRALEPCDDQILDEVVAKCLRILASCHAAMPLILLTKSSALPFSSDLTSIRIPDLESMNQDRLGYLLFEELPLIRLALPDVCPASLNCSHRIRADLGELGK